MSNLSDVLPFWFEEIEPKQWFMGGAELDALLLKRFSGLYEALVAAPDPTIADGAETILATIIVFDQFSRNMFRGEAKAFATDARALNLARGLVESSLDTSLTPQQRLFAYLPFEHAEDKPTQIESVRLFESLYETDHAGPLKFSLDYAYRHRDTIARFGRFPGRNQALGRQSTPEELAFLKENPAGF